MDRGGTTVRVRSRIRRRVRAIALAAAALALAALVLTPGLGARSSAAVGDAMQLLAPRAPGGAPIAIVALDEAALAAHGQWPWPRSLLAELTDRLTEAGAAAIAFDVVMAEPDRLSPDAALEAVLAAGGQGTLPADAIDGDARLAGAFARAPAIAGTALAVEGREPPSPKAGFATIGPSPVGFLPQFPGAVRNLPEIEAAAAGLGVFSLLPEPDGVVRRVPLVYASGETLLPGLSVEALRVAQAAGAIQTRSRGAGSGARAGMETVRVGAFEAPTGPDGRLWLHWSGLPQTARLSAATVLGGDGWAPLVAGHIVLVGATAVGLDDIVATPLGERVAGVEAHAEAIDQIMSGATLARPDWLPGVEIVAAVVVAGLVAWSLPIIGAGSAALLLVLAVAGTAGAVWLGFGRGLVVDPTAPALVPVAAFMAGATALAVLTERDRRRTRETFGLYLAPAVVERLAEDPAAARLDGSAQEVTILFCDLRGFSTLSEGMDPVKVTAMLNDFLTPMTEVLLESGATIDKYIGDAIMAFWNAPLPVPEHRRRALEAALGMGRALDELNALSDRPPLEIGLGLNSGTCCVGNLGSAQRFAYSAIGDPVNVASRVEGLTRFYGVETLATAETVEGTGMATLEVDRVRVKGRSGPVTVHAVLGDRAMAAGRSHTDLAVAQAAWLDAWRVWDGATGRQALDRLRHPTVPQGLLALQERRTRLMETGPRPEGWDGVHDPGEKAPAADA